MIGPMVILMAILLTVPQARAAEEPVGPAEFREYSEGYTLYFQRDGKPFGSERFDPGGKARWRYNDGSCISGAWMAHGAQLCFLYGSPGQDDDALCWRILRDDTGLFARLLSGDNAGLELRIVRRDRRPLLCGDPGTST